MTVSFVDDFAVTSAIEPTNMDNLFSNVPDSLPEELVQILLQSGPLRIERIVSTQHASPAGHWYDQSEHEWVVLLQGNATLLFEGDAHPVRLLPGDWISIPAHRRHRVDSTAADGPTVWLAVFWDASTNHSASE